MEMQTPKAVKTNLKKTKKTERLTSSDIKTYSKVTIIKMVSYWHKDKQRSMKQNRVQE